MSFFKHIKIFFKRVIHGLKRSKIKYKVSNKVATSGTVNIIYISHAGKNVRSGGDKVIYRQSEAINKLGQVGISSLVLHVENPSMRFDWFEHDVSFKKNQIFNPGNDFAVIPEIMVLPHAKMLSDIGVRYAIFVQGGYIMDAYSQHFDELALAYKNAALILAISDDTADCIATAYPWAADKIIRIFYSIDATKFKSSQTKENLITYMPKKLARHSHLIKFFINQRLPADWHFKALHGLDENGVIQLLGKSKIFLSLSELEGWSMPPVEAALCGNHVIGYTGEGAKEYWKAPIFTEIYCGDIKKFVNTILMKIEQLNSASSDVSFDASRTKLVEKYSKIAEKQSLISFLNRVGTILNNESNQI